MRIGILAAAILAATAFAAHAKPATCFTSDDGDFACDFKVLERDGSFEISAPGKPSYSLWMDSPGVAAGFVNFGDRNVSLPGQYLRDAADPACWVNDTTDTKICAR